MKKRICNRPRISSKSKYAPDLVFQQRYEINLQQILAFTIKTMISAKQSITQTLLLRKSNVVTALNQNKNNRNSLDLKSLGKGEAGSRVCLFSMSLIVVQKCVLSGTTNVMVTSMPMYHVQLFTFLWQRMWYRVQRVHKKNPSKLCFTCPTKISKAALLQQGAVNNLQLEPIPPDFNCMTHENSP